MKIELLKEILDVNKIQIDEEKVDKLATLADLLVQFNSHTNLTAITSDTGIATLHFADCLLGMNYINHENVSRETLLDVGAGGGFPTLPLAIVFPSLKITALDSTEKKLRFVKEASLDIGLNNVSVISARAEDLSIKKEYRESFDYVTARAVSKLSIISELCLPFLKIGGTFIAYKGQGYENEIQEAKAGIEKLGGKIEKVDTYPLVGEGDDKTRCLIVIKKVKETPNNYPRNYSQICKKPL